MSKEYESLVKQVKTLRIATAVMAVVIALQGLAFIFFNRLDDLRDARIHNVLNEDTKRLKSELKQLR